jgi:glycosyltransferase involved in cell wall biosynthesis
MPLISVIIPVYNGEKMIRETIDSVLNQTFPDFELLVINDGSTDSTLEVLQTIQDRRLKVFSYPNAGQPVSRNRGIGKAVGEYISFIDADDLWTPDKLEAQLRVLQENPEAAVAYSWSDCIDESSQFFRQGGHLSINGDVYQNLLVVNFLENGSNPLIRRQALMEVGGFDESLSNAHDWDMWLRLAAHYHFIAVPSTQILYRVSPNSMSSNVWGMEASSLRVLEQAFNKAPISVDHLKSKSFGNLYKYLAYKALEGFPERRRGLVAVRFLWQAVINDFTLLKKRSIWKVLFKIFVWILLQPQQAQTLITKFNTLPKIQIALLMQLKIDI